MFYPTGSKKITDNIYAINHFLVNCYVYKKGGDNICIDAGISSFITKRRLHKLGINPEEISHVFLTHTDFDHVGGLKIFKNARIYLSQDEEQMINGRTARAFKLKYNTLKMDYSLLKDDEEINIGETKVKAINTPGHTPGSMSYIVDDVFLFAGDTLTLRNNKIYPFYRLQNMDTRRQKETIKTLAKRGYNISWVFTAHTGYSNNFRDAIREWR